MHALHFLFSSLSLILSVSADTFAQTCLAFTPESHIHNSTRLVLEYVLSGTNLTFPSNDPSCLRPSQLVYTDLCRVALTIPTSNRSSVNFEMWLPRNWTGRYLATGNGGIDGCTKYEDMAYTTQYGFATTGSNNGHNGTGGLAFFKNSEVVEDFAHRSLHVNVVAGKKLIKQFYKQVHTKSYYLGCSQGGRQGIHATELYPHDFDGVVAGAPALNANYLSAWRASFYPITGPSNATDFIQSTTWTGLIHQEILRQCDRLDGVADGIIEDPSICLFRPEALLCAKTSIMVNNTQCLSPAQVKVVRSVYSPLYGESGQLIYPGLQPGAEVLAIQRLLAGAPFAFSVDWFRYVIYSDPLWNPANFTIRDATISELTNPFDIRTWPSTLATFREAGGKLINYHGGVDNQITGFNTERFYNQLSVGMSSTSMQLDEWYRFFRISGMAHCSAGPGAWSLGQGGAAAIGVPFLPQYNVLAAMVEWVENGTAPNTIEGTKFVNDSVALGVAFRRKHCRYPFRNTYSGGNATQASSWKCL